MKSVQAANEDADANEVGASVAPNEVATLIVDELDSSVQAKAFFA